MAAAGVGMAFGVIGDALTDAGFEEAGEIFNKLGNGMMIVSTIAGGLSAILPLVSTGFGAAGAAGATSGAITTAAWGPVGLIVGAALAVILVAAVAVMAILNELKKNSPEQKLKEAEAAAERAAKAADTATESYNNLNNSLENLGDKYDTLEDLTRGTQEWNKAV
jgi:mannitol-specific phosphotransferase system IIBC component